MNGRYAHAGERVLLLASGQRARAHYPEALARRIDRLDALVAGRRSSGMMADHLMEAYLDKLGELDPL